MKASGLGDPFPPTDTFAYSPGALAGRGGWTSLSTSLDVISPGEVRPGEFENAGTMQHVVTNADVNLNGPWVTYVDFVVTEFGGGGTARVEITLEGLAGDASVVILVDQATGAYTTEMELNGPRGVGGGGTLTLDVTHRIELRRTFNDELETFVDGVSVDSDGGIGIGDAPVDDFAFSIQSSEGFTGISASEVHFGTT